ncbi:MAG: hypothetical protein COA52_07535 [Hyphomicrobiales bacterium]|nr:MAG: hypothetical protein COA52_07535 [Hyphomicrobiales bacterium]
MNLHPANNQLLQQCHDGPSGWIVYLGQNDAKAEILLSSVRNQIMAHAKPAPCLTVNLKTIN